MARRLSCLITGAMVAATVLSGCGGDDAGGDGPIELSYGIWDIEQQPALEQAATAFSKNNPNIKIKIQATGWDEYWAKLKAAATGGAAPDVFWMNGPNFKLYASNGMLMPLADRIAAEKVDLSVYPKSLVDLYTYEGKSFGLPKDFDTIGLWYNKKLFDAAGLKYPDESWTWDDLRAAAKKLTAADKSVHGIAAELNNQATFYNTIAQAGGYALSPDGTKSGYDQPATIEGLKLWTDLIKDGLSPTQQQMTDSKPVEMFESGKVAMYYSGSWYAGRFNKNTATKDTVDVAPLPGGKIRAVVTHGGANVVFAKSKHADAAWKFVRFLGSKEAADIIGRSGAVIPAHAGTQQAWIDSAPQFNLKIFIDQLSISFPYPSSKNTAGWMDEEPKHLSKAWAGEVTVEEAAKALAATMNASLAQEK
ncbi:sugar ABC transporter substrate-binding protein [Nonomuraea africana]|uniref:Multiple sugar transport system substrate-binding protein n=1 Tax=Nonomuraea africana TaxID=46171 RepID=A0ABR9K652_9ACTN|nr:sugar ABC transporter substrate-binding protein [Nonomuraea africana]MBE1557489.1 multiple sugar transport system substrate-binding protein [Nonomuraea africana]